MMDARTIARLYEYNSWANHRTLDSCADAESRAVLTPDLQSSFKSVRDTLAHIMGAEWVWLERWHGRSHFRLLNAADYPDFEAIKARLASLWSTTRLDFFAGITEGDSDAASSNTKPRRVRFSYPGLGDVPTRRESWHLSSWPDRHYASPARSEGRKHRPDPLLSDPLRQLKNSRFGRLISAPYAAFSAVIVFKTSIACPFT